jgi:hypothetical protein
VPMQVIEATPSKTVIDIRLVSGHRLRIRAGCDLQWLSEVVAVLEVKTC